ncbi:hypothetical protein ACHAWC_007105 [Mediolabrus comicus]
MEITKVTPSEPITLAMPPGQAAERGKKKRRRSKLISWWKVPNSSAADQVGCVGRVTSTASLSEGENWLVCSSSTSGASIDSLNVGIVSSCDLHQYSGATTWQPFPFDEALNINNSILAHDAEESLAGDENNRTSSNCVGVVLLCIDVDTKGKGFVAVKDIRPAKQTEQRDKSTQKKDVMSDGIAQTAGNIEFFLARRKVNKEVPDEKKAKKSNEAIAGEVGNGKSLDEHKTSSSGESTSGYGTDDEEEGNDEVEELNGRNELRLCDLSSPPKETDRDDEGKALYHHPQLLPNRQLRVLQNGDRILLRYISATKEGSDSDRVSIVKFEYNCGNHDVSQRKAKFAQIKESVANHTPKQTSNEQGKLRLLSVKSADVKSTEKKRFTLNSTSAADAPTEEEEDDEDDNCVNDRKVSSDEMNGHKAGKDWSALGSDNDGGAKVEAGKGCSGTNAAQNDGDDDDGGMEEYSYLTGEVVIKDQDYVSAITGDEATNTLLQPMTAGDHVDDRKTDTSDGDDAATASAVVLGAVNLSPKQPQREADRNIGGGSNKKEGEGGICPKRVALKTSTKHDEEINDVIFEEEAGVEEENSQQTVPFFTANQSEEEEGSDDENMSGEELLSPIKAPKNEGTTAVQHTVHFDSEALAAAGKGDEEDDGSATDYSLTQPFPIPKDVTEKRRSSSSSSNADVENEDDDDDSTVCPEHADKEKLEDSKPPAVQVSRQDKMDQDAGVYDEPTQPIVCPPKAPELQDQSSDDEDYHAETQFEILTSSKKAPSELQHKNEVKPAEEEKIITGEAEETCEAVDLKLRPNHDEERASKPSPKKPSQTNPTEICDNPAIEKQRLDNSAVHRVQSGAMMTGPVGGAVALASPKSPHIPNSLVKTAAMLQRNDPNPLPNAAASSVETTVCQMDDAMNKQHEADEYDHAPVSTAASKRKRSPPKTNQVISGDIGVRDPNIPTEVCITETNHDKETTPRHRASRKRSTPSSRSRSESTDHVRVMFTGITPTWKHKQMIDHIGAILVDKIEDAASATHVIATDGKTKLRRTPKLMICMCRTSNILTIDWLEQSAKEQKVMDATPFLLLGDRGDREAEKTYGFSMADTLKNGKVARQDRGGNGKVARQDRGGVLGGWYIYICNGVAGNKAPSAKELKLLVDAAGATLLPSLSEKYVVDFAKTIVITSDPATKNQQKERGIDKVSSANQKTTSWLFHTMITQTIDDDKTGHHRSKRKASPPSGKRKRRH